MADSETSKTYIPLEEADSWRDERSTPNLLRALPRDFICGCHKLNVLLLLTFLVFLSLLILLGLLLTFGPAAYEVFQLIHDNKDRADQTIETVLRISEEAELVLLDIRSFLEFKLVKALCASRIIRSTIGAFLCPSDTSPTTEPNPSLEKRSIARHVRSEISRESNRGGNSTLQTVYNAFSEYAQTPKGQADLLAVFCGAVESNYAKNDHAWNIVYLACVSDKKTILNMLEDANRKKHP